MKTVSGVTLYVCIVLAVYVLSGCKAQDIIDYYEELISNLTISAYEYEGPEDARMYEAEDTTLRDYGNFDFVIVGAGSTGAVIANRLSEVPEWNILLLEAGKYSEAETTIPGLFSLLRRTEWNWNYKTIPQTTACLAYLNQQCPFPRGKAVGGSTVINGLVYSRGNAVDNDKWAELVDDNSWAYESVLKYYKKSENLHKTDPLAPINWAYHSIGGYWNVENNLPWTELTELHLQANIELGYNITDYNSPQQFGASIIQYNTKRGRRKDHGKTFVEPFLNRKNLHVLTEAYVTKVEIDNVTKTATGVTFTNQGKTYIVNASKEVILSAGTVSSPQLLMLSGIGPKEHLNNLSIAVIADLAVGSTLHDHVAPQGIQFYSNITIVNQTLREEIIDYLNGVGALASTVPSHAVGFYKTSQYTIPNQPNFELFPYYIGTPSVLGQEIFNLNDETWDALFSNTTNNTISIGISFLHPQSIGSIRLKSSDPFDYPLIDSNLMSDPENKDIDALYEVINMIFSMMNTTAFRSVGATLVGNPLPACSNSTYLSKSYWYCFLRQTTQTGFHPSSACLSGTDPSNGAVVDSKLKVFGINGLRVADASVLPVTLSGHVSATCTMVGEKISDEIKVEHEV